MVMFVLCLDGNCNMLMKYLCYKVKVLSLKITDLLEKKEEKYFCGLLVVEEPVALLLNVVFFLLTIKILGYCSRYFTYKQRII